MAASPATGWNAHRQPLSGRANSAASSGMGLPERRHAPPTSGADAHGDGEDDGSEPPLSPRESEAGSLSDASSADSAFSLPSAEVRVGGYLQLVGESAGAADRLDAAIGAMLGLRKALNASSAVPQNVARRLTVVTSQLYRGASEACFSITELSRLAVRFARGLIVSEVREPLRARAHALCASGGLQCSPVRLVLPPTDLCARRNSVACKRRSTAGARSATPRGCGHWRRSESSA